MKPGHTRLFDRIAGCFTDFRNLDLIVHEVRSMVGQRIPGLIAGLEDLNDHDEFRKDPVTGTVLGCMASRRGDCEPLAGKSTLNRLELSAAGFNGKKARKIVADFDGMDDLLVELLIETYEEAPQQIVLDIDATDFELHGDQEDRFFHGYYNEYCYLPVMMFVDRHPVPLPCSTPCNAWWPFLSRAATGGTQPPTGSVFSPWCHLPLPCLAFLPRADATGLSCREQEQQDQSEANRRQVTGLFGWRCAAPLAHDDLPSSRV